MPAIVRRASFFGAASHDLLYRAASLSVWPGLMILCIALTQAGFAAGHAVLGFNLTYLSLAAFLLWLERRMPGQPKWLDSDGQALVDIGHTLINKGLAQVLVVAAATSGLVALAPEEATSIWPASLPMPLQILLGLLVAELGLYWAHRLSHHRPMLWRFHAVHHSPIKLWIVNTGRFHFMDSAIKIVLSLPLPFLLGAPQDVYLWVSAITAYVGILTHCNVDARTGWLNFLFNTPALHRWHHSVTPAEGNRNFGENLMLFDHVFGTFFAPPDERGPQRIGIADPMPESLWGQLVHPFRRAPTA